MSAVFTIEHPIEVLDEDAQEVSRVLLLLHQQAHRLVKHLARLVGLPLESEFIGYILEFEVPEVLREELDEVGVILKRSIPDHAHDTQSVTYLSDDRTKVVQEGLIRLA